MLLSLHLISGHAQVNMVVKFRLLVCLNLLVFSVVHDEDLLVLDFRLVGCWGTFCSCLFGDNRDDVSCVVGFFCSVVTVIFVIIIIVILLLFCVLRHGVIRSERSIDTFWIYNRLHLGNLLLLNNLLHELNTVPHFELFNPLLVWRKVFKTAYLHRFCLNHSCCDRYAFPLQIVTPLKQTGLHLWVFYFSPWSCFFPSKAPSYDTLREPSLHRLYWHFKQLCSLSHTMPLSIRHCLASWIRR